MTEGMPIANDHNKQESQRRRDPVVIRRDLNVWGVAHEDGGPNDVHERVQKKSRERDTRDGRVRDGGREKRYRCVC
jgi:hypothetical protein